MSQQEKSAAFRFLKEHGVDLPKHYRDYTTEELQKHVAELKDRLAPEPPPIEDEVSPEEAAAFFGGPETQTPGAQYMPRPIEQEVPVAAADPNEMPGQRLNSSTELEPLRTDEQGRIWFQEEVRKPAFAQPRGRRVLQYSETGTEQRTIQSGEYVETFEVAGKGPAQTATIKITLPSYQVGIYKDPRFPFKVHVYNDQQGFDLEEVETFYGGRELVPAEVKRKYVENVLCYDIRTVVRAIQAEYRRLQLVGNPAAALQQGAI